MKIMPDVTTLKKNRVVLTEYDCSKDIENRILMTLLTPEDVEVVEEILYSSLRTPFAIIEKNLSITREKLIHILDKLEASGLYMVEGETIIVDKEMRKYFELQMRKFEEDFKPGMEYLQGLLKKVPIHVLPSWYAISRTSDNIFASIVEKYLLTPQVYQRYLHNLQYSDPIQEAIVDLLYSSENYEISSKDIMDKLDLTQEAFEQHMLFLEFSLVACVKFVQIDDAYVEMVTPFHEWHSYLLHIKKHAPIALPKEAEIERDREGDFGIIEEMAEELTTLKNGDEQDCGLFTDTLCHLNLIQREGSAYCITSDGDGWLQMTSREKALYLYRHPLNSFYYPGIPQELANQKAVKEAERAVTLIDKGGWYLFDPFLEGICIPLIPDHQITLQKRGRVWKYQLPEYTDEERVFFRAVIEKWLFSMGIVAMGTWEAKRCFCLTPLGHELFDHE